MIAIISSLSSFGKEDEIGLSSAGLGAEIHFLVEWLNC